MAASAAARASGRSSAAPGESRAGQAARSRSKLRLLPARAPSLRRGPFVMLVLALVVVGTIGLLVLNTVIAADSFRVEQLTQRNAELAVAEQELQRQIAEGLAPEALAEAARDLGMIPAGQPGFVVIAPDATISIQGTPGRAGGP